MLTVLSAEPRGGTDLADGGGLSIFALRWGRALKLCALKYSCVLMHPCTQEIFNPFGDLELHLCVSVHSCVQRLMGSLNRKSDLRESGVG